MLKLGILVSGRGSNMVSILEAIKEKKLDADVKIVISNKPLAPALQKAESYHVKTKVLSSIKTEPREIYDAKLLKLLIEYDVDTVVLAGFTRIITSVLINAFKYRIINIHPALLPSFPGLHAQKQALDYGCKVTGCTTHFVDTGVDTGSIILQEPVSVLDNDTEETLSERILSVEHRLIVKSLSYLSRDKIIIDGRRVYINE